MIDENLYALFAAVARVRPDAVAVVVDEGHVCRYGALAERAAQVAAFLAAHGVRAEEPVGVMMARTPDMIAVLLGILKHGAAYVPVDPDDPPARQRVILDQSGCRLVIAHRARIATLNPEASGGDAWAAKHLVDVDHIPHAAVDPYAGVASGGDRLAYILFTSGSTGRPKGVGIEHRSVVNLLQASRSLFGFQPDDCYLAVSTIGFDISVVEIFLPLVSGGRLLLRGRTDLLDPARLAAEIGRYGVTCMQTGPSMWSVLLARVPDFPRLRVLVSTAEAISVPLARVLAGRADQVWNLYGPTETTIWSTGYRITAEGLAHDAASAISVPIGQPLLNTEVLILDAEGRRVPEGVEGELYLGGLGVARGYHGDEALTRERFVVFDGVRVYRTGDTVSWSREGLLLYHGRNDDQMKIRGVRIDPAEIESVLVEHPAVAQASATWYATPEGMRSIVAAIVPKGGGAPDSAALHTWLQERLPDPMLPSRYVFLAVLPLSPSGKVDRGAIRAMPAEVVPAVGGMSFTPTERALAEIWMRVLRVDRLRPDSHFFTAGGDSLAAVRLLAQVESVFGVVLPVQEVFRYPVLADFAAELDRRGERRAGGGWRGRIAAWWSRRRGAEPPAASGMIAPLAGAVPVAETHVPVTDPAMILPRQHDFVDTWVGHRWRDDALVVTLHAGGASPGLFWCLQGYREFTQLAGHLGADIPVHGMRSGYLIITYDDATHIETLARRYAAEINAIQPEGPLILGGNCQGGMIMRAVADVLQAEGREIGLLILMELRDVRPYAGRVALVFGRESHLNPYTVPGADPDTDFRAAYPGGYEVGLIDGAHGQFFESPNIESLAAMIRPMVTGVSGHAGRLRVRNPLV